MAIIDENTDALIGNLSETDITTLKSDAYGALALPVGEYLLHARHHQPQNSGHCQQNPVQPRLDRVQRRSRERRLGLVVTRELGATIAEVLDAMHVKAVHRVWVVDDAGRPVGLSRCRTSSPPSPSRNRLECGVRARHDGQVHHARRDSNTHVSEQRVIRFHPRRSAVSSPKGGVLLVDFGSRKLFENHVCNDEACLWISCTLELRTQTLARVAPITCDWSASSFYSSTPN